MDVAALRPDELATSSRRRTALLLAPAAALAALAALLAVLVVHVDGTNAQADARAAALAAARQEAVNLTTLSYRSPTQDLDRILAGATGRLRSQFAAEAPRLPALLAAEKSISTGTVLGAGVVRASAGTARVVVATDAQVSTNGGTASVKHYRMVLTLVRRGDVWLASDVAFVGVPQ